MHQPTLIRTSKPVPRQMLSGPNAVEISHIQEHETEAQRTSWSECNVTLGWNRVDGVFDHREVIQIAA